MCARAVEVVCASVELSCALDTALPSSSSSSSHAVGKLLSCVDVDDTRLCAAAAVVAGHDEVVSYHETRHKLTTPATTLARAPMPRDPR